MSGGGDLDDEAITAREMKKREERAHVLRAAVSCWYGVQNEHMMCLEMGFFKGK